MSTISSRLCSRLAISAMVFTAAWGASAQAQTVEPDSVEPATTTTPYALFQYSSLTGSGNTINLTRVPTVNSSGVTSYYDVTITFTVSSSGQLAIASSQFTPSPNLITAGFKAGPYVGPSTVLSGDAKIIVSGPGVASGGATEWSLAAASGANAKTYPCSATWYVGPLTSNPLYSRIQAAKITSTAYSYGVIGSGGCDTESGYWEPDSLIGLSQTGNTLTIVTFSYAGTEDHSTPYDQITYTPSQ